MEIYLKAKLKVVYAVLQGLLRLNCNDRFVDLDEHAACIAQGSDLPVDVFYQVHTTFFLLLVIFVWK